MITTPELIRSLTADAAPVRRLRPPLVRAMLWLLVAALVLALIGASHGVRPDLAAKAREPAFVVATAASLLTGVLAAIAAFMASLPDRSRLWLLLPLPALIAWIATIGYGCVAAWVGLGPGGVRLADVAECFANLVLISAPLWLALLFMLRHAARLRPAAATMMGSLAVAAITAAGLLLLHPLDASIMILVWNLGAAAVVFALGSAFGGKTLSWFALRPVQPHG